MGIHLPNRGRQCVRCYAAYANAFRGRHRKREENKNGPLNLSICGMHRNVQCNNLPGFQGALLPADYFS
jgi:hypothetical protein